MRAKRMVCKRLKMRRPGRKETKAMSCPREEKRGPRSVGAPASMIEACVSLALSCMYSTANRDTYMSRPLQEARG